MIYTYYMNVTQLEDETLFLEKCRVLSPCRQQKIARLRQAGDRYRSLGAGLALDYALRSYGNGLRERDMEYVFGEWGKPSFKDYPAIHFSLSHSGAYAICSIGESPVGNDIERIKKGRLKVAERFFTAQELDFLYGRQDQEESLYGRQDQEESLYRGQDRAERNARSACIEHGRGQVSEEETERRMFRIWTMKESFLKATGRGMTLPLQDFSVIVDDSRDSVRVEHGFGGAVYQMKEYGEIPGYRAAVCCPGDCEMADGMEPAEF